MSGERVHRRFRAGDEEWVAWVAGAGAVGTGVCGLGRMEAVHFAPASAPDRPVREGLLARGRFAGLFDSELAELLEGATPIVEPHERHP